MRRLATFLIVFLMTAHAHADVDFLDQDLTVDLATDPSEVTVTASVRISMVTDTDSLSLWQAAIPLVSIEWEGTPLTVTERGWWYSADLPSTVTAGTEGTLSVVMSGVVDCPYPGGYVTCVRSADLTFLMPPWEAGSWYVMNAEGSTFDDHTGSIAITQPTAHNAAAMGITPVMVDNGDGTSTWTFAFDRQVSYLAFVAGNLDEVTSSDGFSIRGLYQGDTHVRDLMQGMVDEAGLFAPIFSDLWGAPPVEEVDYTTFSGRTPFAGTSIQGLIFLADYIFTPTYSYLISAVSHELAHLWWGTMTNAASTSEFGFFAESMAEYSMWRAHGIVSGEDVRDTGSRMNAVWYMYGRPSPTSDTPVLSPLGTEIAIFAVYHKGSTVVRTLEEAAGAEGLDAGLRAMVEAGPDGANIVDFVDAVDAASGVDLTPYVDIWLRGRGFPVVTVTPSIVESTDGATATISAAGLDFPMQLPFKVLMADGTVIEDTLPYDFGSGEVVIDLPDLPACVQIDPGWTAVRELSPSVDGDVSFDGRVDGADLIEVALKYGGAMPSERRVDGAYDPLYDLDGSLVIDDGDLSTVVAAAE
ncbi:MAG: hypothetical protein JRG91_06175 [Deltaproteobacteria bacterium]|nr:hypothetical protein [Deltaproteobacteria bacterium]